MSQQSQLYEAARVQAHVRRNAAGRLWLYNVGLGCLVGANYLAHVPDEPRTWLFALPALVSTVVFLTLIPGGLVTLGSHLIARPRVLGALQVLLWSLFQTLLFVDTRLYNIFRYHFNGQVLNLLYTGGSADAIHLGWQVYAAFAIGLIGVAGLEQLLWLRSLRISVEDAAAPWPPRQLRLRPALVWLIVLIPAIFVEKTLYAQAELTRDQQVTALSRLFPMYPALPVEEVASSLLGVEIDGRPKVELEGVTLRYPISRPELRPDGPRPNMLMLVVDCLRHDMINPEVAPNAAAFAEDARVFQDHLSGGNSTRFGIFSMLYGLHGPYWFPVLKDGVSPVLLDTLLDLDYEVGVFSTASQSYPELRETAWSRVQDKVHDDFPGIEAWRRDEQSSSAMIEWLEKRAESDQPFFGFLLLDAPHQTYSHPKNKTPFEPTAPEIDYLEITRNEGPDPGAVTAVYNRYRNAVYHADECLGRVLRSLETTDLSRNTIVMVTGDHGEEFWECGFFGHTSAFTPYQVRVPLLMRGPGIEAGVEERPTSHLDIPATLMEILGADPATREDYTLGDNLFAPDPSRRRVIGGWNELGMWVPEAIIRIPLSSYAFEVEVRDRRWNLIPEDHELLRRESDSLQRLADECNRFLN